MTDARTEDAGVVFANRRSASLKAGRYTDFENALAPSNDTTERLSATGTPIAAERHADLSIAK
jgi:hypothetical protein